MTTISYPFRRRILQSVTGAFFLLLCVQLFGQELQVRPVNEQGIYQPGEAIGWNIRLKGAEAAQASYVLKKGGLTEVSQGSVNLSDGEGQIETRLEEPGWLLVEVSVRSGTHKMIKALGGALVSPEKIQPSAVRPADFDSFWAEKLKELAAVPMNPELTPAESGKAWTILK